MTSPLIAHISPSFDEFVGNLHGDCVEYAMAYAIAAAHGTNATPAQLAQIVTSMQGEHLAVTNGATTINACAQWLREHGESVLVAVGYHEPFAGNWQDLIATHAGVHPIVLNVANAQALSDEHTHASDEHGVRYHGLAILDRAADGAVICADGDNAQSHHGFETYSIADIAAAQPCGMVVIASHIVAPAPAAAPQPAPAPTPATGAGRYVVKPGDTLSKIAQAELGNAARWQEIATLNHLANPNLITPGEVLAIPGTHAAPPPAPAPAPRVHVVTSGESLGLIAAHYYGNSARWQDIYNNPANRAEIGPNPNLIKAGQKLIIP